MKKLLLIFTLSITSLASYAYDSAEENPDCGHMQVAAYAKFFELKDSAKTLNATEFLEKLSKTLKQNQDAKAAMVEMGCTVPADLEALN